MSGWPEAGIVIYRSRRAKKGTRCDLVHASPAATQLLGETSAGQPIRALIEERLGAEREVKSAPQVFEAPIQGGVVRICLEPVRSGRTSWVVASLLCQRLDEAPNRAERGAVEALSLRELQVSRLAAAGLGNGEIARELGLSVSTVKLHLAGAFRKLRVQTRTELASLVLTGQHPRSGR